MTTRSLDAIARGDALMAILDRDGAVELESAARELGVSAMTIRRDLAALEADGRARRVRGGGVPVHGPKPWLDRQARASRAKATIAKKASPLVPTSGSIALDASSTVGALAALLGERDLLVATNSWHTFSAVHRLRGPRALLIGGTPEDLTESFVGPIAARAAASLLYDRCFASASAVDAAHGSSDVTLDEAHIKREFAARATGTVLCVDSSKLDSHDVARCFEWSQIDVLITELDPDDERLDTYRELVEIL